MVEIAKGEAPRIVEVAYFEGGGTVDQGPGIEAVHAVGPGRWWLMVANEFDIAGAFDGRAAVFDLGHGSDLIRISGVETGSLLSRDCAVLFRELTVAKGVHLHLFGVDAFAVPRADGIDLLVPPSFTPSLLTRLQRAAADLAETVDWG